MAFQSAYAPLHAAIRAALARTGVHTGGSAEYPRVELHTFIEGEPQDKDNSYRILSATVESLSAVSPDEAAALDEDNLSLLAAFAYGGTDFDVLGIIPRQMTQGAETTDAASLFRVARQIEIHIQIA